MAEFKEVMRKYDEFCHEQEDCYKCPLLIQDYNKCLAVSMAFYPTEKKIQDFEEIVMKGETENVLQK